MARNAHGGQTRGRPCSWWRWLPAGEELGEPRGGLGLAKEPRVLGESEPISHSSNVVADQPVGGFVPLAAASCRRDEVRVGSVGGEQIDDYLIGGATCLGQPGVLIEALAEERLE